MPDSIASEHAAGERASWFKVITAVSDWWGKGVFVFLTASILLLGIGRFSFSANGTGLSAWSVSRTTFFFLVDLETSALVP